MPNPDLEPSLPDTAPIFAALGDRTRLSLVGKLSAGGSHSLSRLAANTNLTRQAVTKHLRVLEEAGLVACRKTGRESLYMLLPDPFERARTYLEDVAKCWDDTLQRLRHFVEEDDQG